MYVLHYRRDGRSPWVWIGEGTLTECIGLLGSGGRRGGDWWFALVRQEPRSLFEVNTEPVANADAAGATPEAQDVAAQPELSG